MGDATHKLASITVRDNAGNTSSVLSVNSFTIDTAAPTLSQVTAVSTPDNDSTPSYTFNSNRQELSHMEEAAAVQTIHLSMATI